MSDFKAKMHQIRFTDPAGRACSAPPYSLGGFKEPTFNWKEAKGGGWEMEGKR